VPVLSLIGSRDMVAPMLEDYFTAMLSQLPQLFLLSVRAPARWRHNGSRVTSSSLPSWWVVTIDGASVLA